MLSLLLCVWLGAHVQVTAQQPGCRLNEELIETANELKAYANCTKLPYLWISCTGCKGVPHPCNFSVAKPPSHSAYLLTSDLRPLRSLTTLTSKGPTGISLSLQYNEELTSLDDLARLQGDVPGSLAMNYNPKLGNIWGLKRVDHWVGGIEINKASRLHAFCPTYMLDG